MNRLPHCRHCRSTMLITSSGLVCERGCGRIIPKSPTRLEALRRQYPELVVQCNPVERMKLSSY